MNYIGQPLVILPTVNSTNNYAMAQAKAGYATHGQAWMAIEQTAGKGQRQKTWQAESGANLTLSLALKPTINLQDQFILSAAIALAVYDFFNAYVGNDTRIKWPNDIYWRDRKAAGILIENIVNYKNGEAYWPWSIVGIGININQSSFDGTAMNAVSLLQITGKRWELTVLVQELFTYIQNRYQQMNDPALLLSQYNACLYKKGEMVRFKKNNRVFNAYIKKVTQTGFLLVDTDTKESFSLREVEWLRTLNP
jgi:BirA family transcriptional regulator, biotin operon repressor / biotin---[acetyl-CoA-carboxylase] ligase